MNFIKNRFVQLIMLTMFILFIPFIGMQFSENVKWGALDFFVMACLCLGFGGSFIVFSRLFPRIRLALGIAILVIFILVWAELSVGLLTDLNG